MKLKATLLGIGFLFFSLYLCNLPAVAEEAEQNTETTLQPFRGLPIRKQNQIIEKKIKQSQQLSHWVYETLEKEKASVAIITRKGPPLTRFLDKTGLTHVGFVFKRPDTKQWITYSLYSDPSANYKTTNLWQETVEDFYYGQSGKQTDALMLIPPADLQQKLLSRLTAQPFDDLLPDNEGYNLLAPLESPTSFNCTKWILLQLYGARENTDNTLSLIQQMAREYFVPTKKPFFLARRALKRKPDVNWEELSPPNQVHTITVSSLYSSPLFVKKLYYHDTN